MRTLLRIAVVLFVCAVNTQAQTPAVLQAEIDELDRQVEIDKVLIDGLHEEIKVLQTSLKDNARAEEQMGKGVMEVTTGLQREVASLQQQINSLKPKPPETK